MKHCADDNVVCLWRVENQVRLKTKAPMAGRKFVHCGADLRKVGDQAECTLEARMVGVSLISAEGSGRIVVDVDQVRAGAFGEPKLSHESGGVAARRRECPPC